MRRPDLVSDCRSCDALCCVAPSFDASDDFAIDKPAGARCPQLTADHRCGIYAGRIEGGFRGCTVYECYGAGPKISQAFAGVCDAEPARIAAFLSLRAVHELLWQLTEAAKLCPPSCPELAEELEREIALLDAIAYGPRSDLPALDLSARERSARAVLRALGTALGGRRNLRVLPAS